nr:Gfo/Idh/MocA family oxidoreductase [uncultured Carboxylicivirga sp.]
MIKVITYGTYDLLHQGHINLLKRAKDLGDYLIVGVTSDSFDKERGKLNVRNNLLERIEAVKKTGLADKIIIEEYVGQKIDNIQRYGIDIFAIGSDWEGKFDYLNEYCQVNYLPRTKGISSTMLREEDQVCYKLGIVGTGRIANRFIPELEHVQGVKATAVFNPKEKEASEFAKKYEISLSFSSFDSFIQEVDAVYIASPHLSHYEYCKQCLLNGKHVLCEIPFVLSGDEARELYKLAEEKRLVLMEANKTAHSPAFNHLVMLIKTGVIGDVVDIDSSLSKLTSDKNLRELDRNQAGGSVTELAPIPLLSIIKILGRNYKTVNFYSRIKNGVDIYTKGIIAYDNAVASIKLGLGVKTEGNLVVSGTKGYVYVPAPWWRTEYFELRYEDQNKNKKYFYSFEGDGLRYEIQEFISCITNERLSSFKLGRKESAVIADIIKLYRDDRNVTLIN